MNKYIQYIILTCVIISAILLLGCMRNGKMSKFESDTENELKYGPIKVKMHPNVSILYEELGFEYSTIEEAEKIIVAELDSIYETEDGHYIHRMHNDKLCTLIKSDPRAFVYDFPLMQNRGYVNLVTSDDKKLRLFSWDTEEGGTMISWGNLCQFESDGDVFVYECGIYEIENEDVGEFSPGCDIWGLHTLRADNGDTYYLAQIYIRESSNLGFQEIYPVKISNGRLTPVKIFDIDSENECNNCTSREYFIADWYFKTAGEGWDWLYRFDKENQIIYVPEVIKMELTDRYNLYRFDGEKFDYVSNNGGFWLHPDIRDFRQLEWLFCTEDYRIRIDLMADNTYRYTSWRKNKSMIKLPDLIILNGCYNEVEGNYYFENNGYTYCVAPDPNNSNLTICHAGNVILQQTQTTTDTMLY